MRDDQRHVLIGAVVLAALAAVGLLGEFGARGGPSGYPLTAVFQRTDGLGPGAEVRLSGMPIGRVSEMALDARFRSVVTFVIDADVPIPEGSAAVIETDGLLGTKYVEIQPGGGMDMLAAGGRISYTQDSVVLEDLLARIIEQAKAQRGLGGSDGGGGG